MKNLKLKAKAAVLAGVTLVTSTGLSACGKEEKLENHNNPALSPVSASDSSQVDAVTTDVTTDENGNAYVTDADGETSYVETSYTTYTTDDQGNAYVTDLDGETSYVETTVTTDSYTDYGSKTSSVNRVTTAKSISGNGDVTTKKTTDNETTKKGSTTNTTATTKKPTTTKTTTTTKKTTPTTTKKTTTTTKITTTTTKATTVTQPPVQNYTIDDICYNVDAFEYFANELKNDLMNGYTGYIMPYGLTNCYYESRYILALINDRNISPEVIRKVFDGKTEDDFYNYSVFVNNFSYFQNQVGCYVEFPYYACNNRKEYGNYIKSLEDSSLNGSIQSYIKNQIVDGNINPNYLSDTAVMSYCCAYDVNFSFSHEEIEEAYVYEYISYMDQLVSGRGLSK